MIHKLLPTKQNNINELFIKMQKLFKFNEKFVEKLPQCSCGIMGFTNIASDGFIQRKIRFEEPVDTMPEKFCDNIHRADV
mgnify:CR=1 FL=1